MEDENGLELSLGLGFGGSSTKSKGTSGGSLGLGTEDEKVDKPKDDFKVLLGAGSSQNQDLSGGAHSHRSDSVKPLENFFHDLTSRNSDGDASMSLNARSLWVGSVNKSAEIEEEKRTEEGGHKRKVDFDDVNNQKRVDFHNKKTSHISLTEDGSTAENEDVAESEVEGSTSRFVSQHDEGSKRFVGVGGQEAPKDFQRFPDASVGELQGQRRRSNGSRENEFKHGINFGTSFSVEPSTTMNMSYQFPMKDHHHPVGSASTTGRSLSGMTPIVSTSNAIQTANPGGSPITFGYSPVQLPTLDINNSWGLVSQQQQFQPSYGIKAPANPDKHNEGLRISQAMQIIGRNPTEAAPYDSRVFDWPKGDGKQQTGEQGTSSKADNEAKVSSNNTNLRAADGFSLDFSAIKPGISPDVKLGGCGSYPNLPWVSTTAPGPNGRTISGVTYRYSASQIRIVCACHGSHMSPEEFIRHAADGKSPSPAATTATGDGNSGAATVQRTTNNPSASARS